MKLQWEKMRYSWELRQTYRYIACMGVDVWLCLLHLLIFADRTPTPTQCCILPVCVPVKGGSKCSLSPNYVWSRWLLSQSPQMMTFPCNGPVWGSRMRTGTIIWRHLAATVAPSKAWCFDKTTAWLIRFLENNGGRTKKMWTKALENENNGALCTVTQRAPRWQTEGWLAAKRHRILFKGKQHSSCLDEALF